MPAALASLPLTSMPRWGVMWGLALLIYVGLKGLSWRTISIREAPAWKHLAYLLAWPGMDARTFLLPPRRAVSPPSIHEWGFAVSKLLAGTSLVVVASTRFADWPPLVRGWIGMIGIVLTLHFGLFHLLSCGWRAVGLPAVPLMDWPLTATSLGEFWGQRWNRAFRDLTHDFVFQPLRLRLGATAALWIGFALSGLVHDVVISLPAGGGWGLPTLYFLLQSAGISLERSPRGRRLGLRHRLPGRVFTATVLLVPLPLLFHTPFVERVIAPFLQTIGQTP